MNNILQYLNGNAGYPANFSAPASDVCYMCSNALRANFITDANTIKPDQIAPRSSLLFAI